MSFTCIQCRKNFTDQPRTGIKELDGNRLGTDLAKFLTFAEYAWHMKNIHGVELRHAREALSRSRKQTEDAL